MEKHINMVLPEAMLTIYQYQTGMNQGRFFNQFCGFESLEILFPINFF